MHSFGQRVSIALLCVALCVLVSGSATATPSSRSSDTYIRQIDDLSALWSFYKQTYIQNGRVVSLDEHGITTSEGQGYAMLRAVWSNDRTTFNTVWAWTKQHLQVRDDKLFAWKWKGAVLDKNSATDADTDIALALILAARRFDHPPFEQDALAIIDSIWNQEIVHVGSRAYITAGNWAREEDYPTIHVAYLAPMPTRPSPLSILTIHGPMRLNLAMPSCTGSMMKKLCRSLRNSSIWTRIPVN